jgi:hypothetical protein
MKKTNLLFAVIAFFIALSCSKSSTSSSSSSGQKKVKTVEFYNYSIGNQMVQGYKFIYQNDKIVNIIQKGTSYNSFSEISYIDSYNTKIKVYTDTIKDDSFLSNDVFIKYNSNKEVIYDSTLVYDWQHNIVSRIVRKYQYNGNILEVNTTNNGINIITQKYTIQNENIILDDRLIEKKYDNYINPLYRLKFIFGYLHYLTAGYLGDKTFTKNNLVLEKYPNLPPNHPNYEPDPAKDNILTCQYDNQGDLISTTSNIPFTLSLKFTYY